MDWLLANTAYITIISSMKIVLYLYVTTDVCEECPPALRGVILPEANNTFTFNTRFSHTLILKTLKDNVKSFSVCTELGQFSEYGRYKLSVSSNANGEIRCDKISLIANLPRENIWNIVPVNLIGLVLFLLIFYNLPRLLKSIFLGVSSITGKYFASSNQFNLNNVIPTSAKNSSNITKKGRLLSLDVFRGVNVLLMVFINAGGGNYSSFEHKIWGGMNFAELPHGWFNWILGMSVAIKSNIDRNRLSSYQRIEQAFHRTTRLFLLGFLISSYSFTKDLNQIPYFGVLQDLGILYLVAVMIDLVIPRKVCYSKSESRWLNNYNFINLKYHWLVLVLVAAVHNALLFGFQVPNCERGYLGPGGLHMNGSHKNCTGGVAGYIDRLIVGKNHLASGIKFSYVYETKEALDPYGPFGLLGQLVQVYFGILAGETLLFHKQTGKVIIRKWLYTSFAQLSIAWLMCNITFGYCFIPCIRRLWTLTYTLIICSSATTVMSILYFAIDLNRLWSGWPFYYPGTNSIFIYVGQLLLKHSGFPFFWVTKGQHLQFLFQHLWQTLCWLFISYIMYSKKIFLNV